MFSHLSRYKMFCLKDMLSDEVPNKVNTVNFLIKIVFARRQLEIIQFGLLPSMCPLPGAIPILTSMAGGTLSPNTASVALETAGMTGYAVPYPQASH